MRDLKSGKGELNWNEMGYDTRRLGWDGLREETVIFINEMGNVYHHL